MSNYEIKINAINMRDVQIALKEWCTALQVMPDIDPEVVLQNVDLDTLRLHLEERLRDQGFTLDIKAMIDEVVEVKAPKKARKEAIKEKAEARLKELVLDVDETDPAVEAVKADVIRQLQSVYLQKGGKEKVDDIIARYGNGETKLSAMPASVFPAIAEEIANEPD